MLPASLLAVTQDRLLQYAKEYHGEVPTRLHGRDLDRGGAPQWHAGFANWMTRSTRPAMDEVEPDRIRVTRAMRILRKACPREADVVYRALVLGHGAEEIQEWLNQRAIAGGHPERFSLKDATVLIISGMEKIDLWA